MRGARRQMLAPLVRHVRNQVDAMRRRRISECVWKRQKPLIPDSREWTSRVKKRHWLSSSENGRPPRKTFAIRQFRDSLKDATSARFLSDHARQHDFAHDGDAPAITSTTASDHAA